MFPNTESSRFFPDKDEYDNYYHQYISLFQTDNFLDAFAAQIDELKTLLEGLSDGVDSQLHEPYTWTIKQVVGHLIDCERIFSTRLLRIAVGDTTPIPGIDQNIYVANLDYEHVTLQALLEELSQLRQANTLLAKRMGYHELRRRGIASEKGVSARANLLIIAGHVVYHMKIIRQRLQSNHLEPQ
ncbi:MAG: DinB family protein [Pirellulaceae bacterium]